MGYPRLTIVSSTSSSYRSSPHDSCPVDSFEFSYFICFDFLLVSFRARFCLWSSVPAHFLGKISAESLKYWFFWWKLFGGRSNSFSENGSQQRLRNLSEGGAVRFLFRHWEGLFPRRHKIRLCESYYKQLRYNVIMIIQIWSCVVIFTQIWDRNYGEAR